MFAYPARRALWSFLLLLLAVACSTALLSLTVAARPAAATSNPERPDIPYRVLSADETEFVSSRSQPSGLITVHAPSGPSVTTTNDDWEDIPHMRGRVTIKEWSSLALSFCAETSVTAGKRLFVRALLNGQPADPSDVLFAYTPTLNTNCFTFVKANAPPDIYAVRLQWAVDSGGTAYLGDRTLTISYAVGDAPEMRLAVKAAPSGPDVVHSGGWTDIPDLQTVIEMPGTGDLAVTLTAEAHTSNAKRMFVRALVDGVPAQPTDQVLTPTGYEGTRAVTFTRPGVSPGTHVIKLQWQVDGGGDGYLGDRTLTVTGVTWPPERQAGALFVSGPSGPQQQTPGPGWHDVPNMAGTLVVPTKGDLAINFSAEIYAAGGASLFLRALVDGAPVSPSDVLLTSDGWRGTYAYTFVKRNVSRGEHEVRIQWAHNGSGQGNIGDRTLAAYAVADQVPVLFVAMESNRGAPDYAYGGLYANSVVEDAGGQRVFRPYVRERLAGGAPSVADYFRENSGERYFLTEAAVLGPWLKQYDEKYYREQVPNPFTTMKLEALQKADQVFDFSLYDNDGSGVVDRSELLVNVIFYQDTTFGEVRTIPDYVSNNGVTLSGSNIATVYTPDFTEPEQIGLFAHELAHAGIGAGDMYEAGYEPTAPGPYSLMDQHRYHPHLDPLHKIRAGDWFDPIVVPKDGYYEIPAVELETAVFKLHDPGSHAGEYFLVENREHLGYDQYLPDYGLAIWHIDENVGANDFWRKAVEMEPASGYVNPPPWDQYLFDGAGHYWGAEFTNTTPQIDSRWRDGSASNIGVYAISPGEDVMEAFFDVPGPGILVDVKPDLAEGDQTVVFEVRLVNTHTVPDTFALTTNLPGGWASWSQNPVPLNGYEERIVELTVTPSWGSQAEMTFAVTGQSTSNPAVSTVHPATMKYKQAQTQILLHLPMIIR